MILDLYISQYRVVQKRPVFGHVEECAFLVITTVVCAVQPSLSVKEGESLPVTAVV